MKATIIIASIGLAISSSVLAHEGHDHGLSKEEIAKQVKEGKLCVLNGEGSSLGAVVEKDEKYYRCVKAYGKDLGPQTELVWVELKLQGNALVTAP
ncbi:MAG: hypothetical protein B0W54_14000 [Cellvibrio sp. 79]|nr:MAG: hypothetical protein B0W54_14000 [Cellvibrio sp. 79]